MYIRSIGFLHHANLLGQRNTQRAEEGSGILSYGYNRKTKFSQLLTMQLNYKTWL